MQTVASRWIAPSVPRFSGFLYKGSVHRLYATIGRVGEVRLESGCFDRDDAPTRNVADGDRETAMKRGLAASLAFAGATLALAVPASGQRPVLAMLDTLDRGDWEMRFRNDEVGARRICLENGRELLQLRHPGEKCHRVVVDESATEVIVQYTCPGRGYGRTRIRRESSRLVQIDSQGIARGLPFAFAAEARRVGACSN